MIYIIITLVIVIGILSFQLYHKQHLDRTELENLKEKVRHEREQLEELNQQLTYLQIACNDARNDRICEETHTRSLKEAAKEALQQYHDIVDIKMNELDASIEEQRQKRYEELENNLKEKQQYYEKLLEETINQCAAQDEAVKEASATIYQEATAEINQYNESIAAAKERFESIERTLRQYDAEQQAKLFYTIQLPEEYREDIEFLLTTVAAKVQHPDIISKLVWAEYVKPNLDQTFKRLEVKAEPGIYKLTSLETGKPYIGKSTDVKKRIADHFKSTVGMKSIADQAVHHAILKEGFWNWTIEVITYCDKDKLNELEKYYIDFFNTQEFGWNRNVGGGG